MGSIFNNGVFPTFLRMNLAALIIMGVTILAGCRQYCIGPGLQLMKNHDDHFIGTTALLGALATAALYFLSFWDELYSACLRLNIGSAIPALLTITTFALISNAYGVAAFILATKVSKKKRARLERYIDSKIQSHRPHSGNVIYLEDYINEKKRLKSQQSKDNHNH